VSLRIDGGSLLIRNGLTHYPQKAETYRFFKGELAIPERIIMLDGTGSISFDVLAWLAEQRVSLIQINWKGEVSSFTLRPAVPQILIAYSGSEKRALIVRILLASLDRFFRPEPVTRLPRGEKAARDRAEP
jgi:hypothetical protein